MEVADFLIHPNFENPKSYFDVGLLKLSQKVTFSDFILPVCLPTIIGNDLDENADSLVTLTGWGKSATDSSPSSELKRTDLQIFSQLYVCSYVHCVIRDIKVSTCSYCNQTHSGSNGASHRHQIKQAIPRLFQNDLLCAGHPHEVRIQCIINVTYPGSNALNVHVSANYFFWKKFRSSIFSYF